MHISLSLLQISNFGLNLAEGFGINTNIFETNIINLAAVLAVVISFVGKNLTALLEDRKKTILGNLQEASQRAAEAQERLNQAKAQLELAKKKAQQIREEGVLRATQEVNNCVSQHEERLSKLEEFKQETVQFYQQKAFKQAYIYVISRIMSRVKERLNKGLDSTYHVVVNNFYVSRFTEYNP
uniref:ATP synthase subunit b, chloroplastic n=2 Tax=Pseudopediastrum TaxID=427904 RepID=A0A2U8GJ06_PSEBY|nr:ATP synthase CF0 B subunit [Pseudopediastrum boryanum]YP_009492249.1 ATP synthase CF0 B subunit [Pseudopediastrum sp. CL0201VA]AWI68636.1 ATP synthase CF0 B subunit [Pseudopediastrum boryanum]AWI68889.1 ATP synthase CF0 B subunit [Pseudopediastrum sp. CL0201VA]